ncbi:unnamed protein product, partial [Prorocentrum cordatum]
APAPWRSDVIWSEAGDGELGDGDGSSVLTASFKNVQLDGLHKVKSDAERAARVDGMQEFRLLFVEACRSEAAPCQQLPRQSKVILEDYDHLHEDTDHEDLYSSIICRGILLRTKNLLAQQFGVGRPSRRLCELDASGKLHIVGAHLLDALVVDVAEEGSRAVWEVPQTEGLGGPVAWKVKNPRTRVWETLQVEDRDHARMWDESLHDAALVGDAARDSGTAFHGFFWCATQLPPDSSCGREGQSGGRGGSGAGGGAWRVRWRARLLVLRRDGLVGAAGLAPGRLGEASVRRRGRRFRSGEAERDQPAPPERRRLPRARHGRPGCRRDGVAHDPDGRRRGPVGLHAVGAPGGRGGAVRSRPRTDAGRPCALQAVRREPSPPRAVLAVRRGPGRPPRLARDARARRGLVRGFAVGFALGLRRRLRPRSARRPTTPTP